MGMFGFNPAEDMKKNAENAIRDQQMSIYDSKKADRMKSIKEGAEFGQEEFYNDPDMQRMRKLREDMAKGYSGEELGALRETARGQIRGAQASEQRKLSSGLARGGVGGARGAAIQGAQGQEGVKAAADAERKMALDSGNMQRQGTADLQDFIFRQKMGKMGTAFGMAGLDSADFASKMAAQANKGGGKK